MDEKVKYFLCKEKQIKAVNNAVIAEIPFSTMNYKISNFPYHRICN
jgi:hypothetical protein